ncbi:MAG: hypothetical protein KAS12_04730 [Candidatus Aenigmarchaeota archaeon]|nr:hypothetical protein [Candidatus Aenigmarchaeota archaeon]
MSNYQIKIFPSILASQQEKEEKIINFIPEVNQESENKLGKLFILGKVDSSSIKNKLLDLFQETLVKNYYYNHHPLDEQKDKIDINAKLENSIELLNQKINLKLVNLPTWSNNSYILIIIIKNNQVYFTGTGKFSALLIAEQKITNLFDTEKGKEQINFNKLFPYLVSGTLEKEQVLFFSNKYLWQSIQKMQLNKIFSDLPIQQANKYLENYLTERQLENSVEILMIKNEPPIDEPSTQKPIIKVDQTQPSEKITVKLIGQNNNKQQINIQQKINQAKPDIKLVKEKSANAHQQNVKQFLAPAQIKKHFKQLLPKFKSPDQLILTIGLILLVLFIISSAIIGGRQIKQQRDKKFDLALTQIQNKQAEISSALIYQDKIKAKKSLNETELLIDSLDADSIPKDYRTEFATIQNKQQELIEQIYYLITIKQPDLLADFSQAIDKKIDLRHIWLIEHQLYSFNPANNFIYQFNPDNQQTNLLSQSSQNIGYLIDGSVKDKDHLLFYHQNQGLAQFDLVNQSLDPLTLTTDNSSLQIKDIVCYQDNLYILDSQQQQIFKYEPTIDGYGKEIVWLKESIPEINQAISMSIDSSIYLLTKSSDPLSNNSRHQIIKLYQGKQLDFSLEDIYPALQQATKIITELDWLNIYLLDPTEQRLIIFDKQGKLKKQFTSPLFTNLDDLAIDYDKQIAYLLNENKVYSIDLSPTIE